MRRKFQIYILFLPLFISVMWAVFGLNRITAKHEYLITKYYRFESLTEEPIVQEFIPTYDYLEKLELFIANIYPETDGVIMLQISDQDGKTVFKKNYAASQIPTGEFFPYKIGKDVIRGNVYKIYLSYIGETVDGPQIMVSEVKKNLLETGNMYVSDELSEYNMAITYYYKESRAF